LLIVPAAAARAVARSPEGMALGALVVGWAAVVAGLGLSLAWDTPAGPSIVAAAALAFAGLMAGAGLVGLSRRARR
jgi:zinc transport system permease protein